MTKATFGDASTTAASNTTFDGANIDEGCPPSGINNAIRSVVAAAKGALTAVATSGTNTYTATLAPAPDALATNFVYIVNVATASTSTAPTINFNSFGAKTVFLGDGTTALVSGDLNGLHWFVYDGTNLRVLNPRKSLSVVTADATNGGLSISSGLISLAPSDLVTKATPTTSDSIIIMDAANSNKASTAPLPATVGALFSPIHASLGADVNLNNPGTYFDGPSIAQGTTGTWLAWGTITVTGVSGDRINVKLWDGTTVMASTVSTIPAGTLAISVSLSGFLASPAANIKISAEDRTNTTGIMRFNLTGNSKDSTIS